LLYNHNKHSVILPYPAVKQFLFLVINLFDKAISLTMKFKPMNKFLSLTLLLFCTITAFAQATQQTLVTPWPEEYTFKVGSEEDLGNMHVIQSIPQEEAPDKWTLLTNVTTIKNMSDLSTAGIIEMFRKSTLEEAPNAKLTVIENKPKAKNVYVLFKVEIPRFHYDPQPQSRLYYIVQGDHNLFVNYVAVKEKTLDKSFLDKWTKVLKASKLEFK